MTGAVVVLSLVTLQRLLELGLARRNTARLLAAGAYEVGAGHYPLIVALHGAWLVGLWALGSGEPLRIAWLVPFVALQLMRLWVLATLNGRWTTRIIVLPGAPLVRAGPYRLVAHPNYVIVVGEIALLPLALGLPWFALVSSLLNAAVLTIRIRAENAALATAGSAPAAGGVP
jgi:methyltransferase